ncbi:MAG TPA: biotin/lipoyl-containing protein [Polyangiaceae bacterium]
MTSKLLHFVVELEDGSRFDVHIDPSDLNSLTVDGVTHDVKVEESQSGLVVSTEEGQRVPLQLRYEHGELIAHTPDGVRQRITVRLADSHEFRNKILSQPPPPPVEHSGRLTAPIAGNIVRLCVSTGSEIKTGDAVVVLEAMKMQNTISAPVSGIVTYSVIEGQTVRAGDLLATIDQGSKS